MEWNCAKGGKKQGINHAQAARNTTHMKYATHIRNKYLRNRTMQNTSNILGGKLASIIWNNSKIQSGASSRRKIGGAYFSDVTGSIQDPIAVPGPCEVAEF